MERLGARAVEFEFASHSVPIPTAGEIEHGPGGPETPDSSTESKFAEPSYSGSHFSPRAL